eukprot:scaffold5980_cov145-Isochrysis_galbana.AAC.5
MGVPCHRGIGGGQEVRRSGERCFDIRPDAVHSRVARPTNECGRLQGCQIWGPRAGPGAWGLGALFFSRRHCAAVW